MIEKNGKIGYESQIEGLYQSEKMKSTRGHIQSNNQPHGQVGVAEAPNNMKE